MPIKIEFLFSCFDSRLAIYYFGKLLALRIPLEFAPFPLESNLLTIVIFCIALLSTFYPFIIINENPQNPFLAFKKSFIMTINNFFIAGSVYFLIIFMNCVVGLFTLIMHPLFFLGFIVSLPLSLLSYIKIYLLINGK